MATSSSERPLYRLSSAGWRALPESNRLALEAVARLELAYTGFAIPRFDHFSNHRHVYESGGNLDCQSTLCSRSHQVQTGRIIVQQQDHASSSLRVMDALYR